MSKFKIKRHAGQQIRINTDTIITVVSTSNASVSLAIETASQNLITIMPGAVELPQKSSYRSKRKVKANSNDKTNVIKS